MTASTEARSLLVVAFASLLILFACDSKTASERSRVLLIGIDGASPRMTERLFAKGELPNLARLRDEGAYGPLESLIPLVSPRIWNSIVTGKRPDKHGILSFAHPDENGVRRLFLSTDRRVHALWNILSDSNRSVSVVNWWNTFPPEKIKGVMVSDHYQGREVEKREQLMGAVKTPHGAVVYPEEWGSRLDELVADDEPPIAFDDPFANNSQLPHAKMIGKRLSNYFHEDGVDLRVALEVERSERPDVMLVFFPGIDRVSHFLWGMIEPPELYEEHLRPSPSERTAGTRALEAYYQYTDALIGALLERYGPNDLVVVVSDHGFEAGTSLGVLTGGHDSEKAQNGVIFARGPGIPAGISAGKTTILDITPTILTWLGLPVGEDMDGRVADFIRGEPVGRIETWDGTPIERLETTSSGVDDNLLENLRALGYFEEEDSSEGPPTHGH